MHAPNALIARVCDIKVSRLIKANPGGTIQLGALRRATIAFETSHTSARNYLDGVVFQIQTSNLVTAGFGKTKDFMRLKGKARGLP